MHDANASFLYGRSISLALYCQAIEAALAAVFLPGGRMEAFSGLLFRLYRLAQNSPPKEFQTHALNQVREVLALIQLFG